MYDYYQCCKQLSCCTPLWKQTLFCSSECVFVNVCCVFSACVFRAMFELDMRECVDGSVTLSSLSAQAVHTFLDFAYSGEIEIREDNVEMLFQMASFLQVRLNTLETTHTL